jgi:hypothetical protein
MVVILLFYSSEALIDCVEALVQVDRVAVSSSQTLVMVLSGPSVVVERSLKVVTP